MIKTCVNNIILSIEKKQQRIEKENHIILAKQCFPFVVCFSKMQIIISIVGIKPCQKIIALYTRDKFYV